MLAPGRERESLSSQQGKKGSRSQRWGTSGSDVQRPVALLPAPCLKQVPRGRNRGVQRHSQALTYEASARNPSSLKKAAGRRGSGESIEQVGKVWWPALCQNQGLKWSLEALEGRGSGASHRRPQRHGYLSFSPSPPKRQFCSTELNVCDF